MASLNGNAPTFSQTVRFGSEWLIRYDRKVDIEPGDDVRFSVRMKNGTMKTVKVDCYVCARETANGEVWHYYLPTR